MSWRLIEGDCLDVLPTLEDASVDAVVTDPPYGIGFMGKEWDTPGSFVERKPEKRNRFDHVGGNHNPVDGFDRQRTQASEGRKFQAWCSDWAGAVLRVLKPGGYMLCFGGSRTYHRLACAVEDAGFEIRDCLMWLYGQGFPKGDAQLKPAYEPILLCRRPAKHVAPLSIDECRVACEERPLREKRPNGTPGNSLRGSLDASLNGSKAVGTTALGRWPANVLHDGSGEVLEAFAAFGERASGSRKPGSYQPLGMYANAIGGRPAGMEREMPPLEASTGTAARFFYCSKASRDERGEGNTHPTVKPLALMRWCVRLVTATGGVVLDPFAGSGTTLLAAELEGRNSIGIERHAPYCEIIRRRMAEADGQTPLFAPTQGGRE